MLSCDFVEYFYFCTMRSMSHTKMFAMEAHKNSR